jgi:hypothetical protein
MLGISYKSTWFMMHRLREAMRTGGLEPLGGEGKTYIGQIENPQPSPQRKGRPYKYGKGPSRKRTAISLVERGGKVRSFHPAMADAQTVVDITVSNIKQETRLHTDESRIYKFVGEQALAPLSRGI